MLRDRSDVKPGRPPGGAVAPRGRPRSSAADGAIRDATIELLTEVGYASLTMSGVAARAGVSTATLYRRWRSKLDLVIAVLRGRAQEVPVPDTGSLRGDCRAVLRDALKGRRETPGGSALVAGLVGEIRRDPELADAVRRSLIAPRRATLAAMLARAEQRGELRPGLDYELIIDLLFGPLQLRWLLTGQPVTERVADDLADLVVAAVGPPPTEARPTAPRPRPAATRRAERPGTRG